MNQNHKETHMQSQGQKEKPSTNPLKSIKVPVPETRERYDSLTGKKPGTHK